MNKTKSNKLWIFIAICYLLFSIYLLFINIISNIRSKEIYDLFGLVFIIGILFVLKKFQFHFKVPKYIYYCVLIIPLISRFILLFLNYTNIYGDYYFFLESSKSLANNLSLNTSYISLFPYLYPYIFILGNLMKLIGSNYITVIILNILIDLLGSFCFYKLIKLKNSKEFAKKALLIWLYNPFNILWITKCCPVIFVNTLLIIILLIFELLRKSTKIQNIVLYSILLGLCMSITNAFRPIIIIFVIALFIYFIFKYINKSDAIKRNILSFGIIILIYILGNFIINQFISSQINHKLPQNSGGWSIYVGANYKYNGRWNEEDSAYFYELQNQYNNIEIHKVMQQKGIDRYKELKAKSLILLAKKSKVLGTGETVYTYSDVFNSINTPIPSVSLKIIQVYLAIFWYYILISNFLISISLLKKKHCLDNNLIPIGIFGLGLFLSTLLVEVSTRYFFPILIIIMTFVMLYKTDK